ncbi:MAG: PLP-dependent aminotransferase family protein [Oscillospiraceae bacterium]|nr:PLP-dependent aminotransferase family protein [Oscillospiraceae bacterium]
MLTYDLTDHGKTPMYEYLYQLIREDILSGRLKKDEKLPSKRTLAEHLSVSKITVENAYAQLLAEGYIYSKEKKGYFAEDMGSFDHRVAKEREKGKETQMGKAEPLLADFTQNNISESCFPYAAWAKTMRRVIMDEPFVHPAPYAGLLSLRQAIGDYLYRFRGMRVSPDEIVIGAGTEYLYHLIIQLLGRELCYAVEDPGYRKVQRVFAANGVKTENIALDESGVRPDALACSGAQVLHISPSHHFPTGIVTPAKRRMELLQWAAEGEDRYILEDDYDSEFRFAAHPMPAMQALDRNGRVIYMNTFSKTLAPSIRISYLVMPPELMGQFQKTLGFYGCTVPSFEQYTLARFLRRGHFEKHINRMRRFYRARRNHVVQLLEDCVYADRLTILEQDAGLHFLVRVDTRLPDAVLTQKLEQAGIRVRCLSSYYHDEQHRDSHCLVVNYSGLREDALEELPQRLRAAFG